MAGSSLAVGAGYGGNFMEIAPSGGQYPRHDSLQSYQDDLYTSGMASGLPAFHKHYLASSFRWWPPPSGDGLLLQVMAVVDSAGEAGCKDSDGDFHHQDGSLKRGWIQWRSSVDVSAGWCLSALCFLLSSPLPPTPHPHPTPRHPPPPPVLFLPVTLSLTTSPPPAPFSLSRQQPATTGWLSTGTTCTPQAWPPLPRPSTNTTWPPPSGDGCVDSAGEAGCKDSDGGFHDQDGSLERGWIQRRSWVDVSAGCWLYPLLSLSFFLPSLSLHPSSFLFPGSSFQWKGTWTDWTVIFILENKMLLKVFDKCLGYVQIHGCSRTGFCCVCVCVCVCACVCVCVCMSACVHVCKRERLFLVIASVPENITEYVRPRIRDHNGISQLYDMLEIYHSGPELST